LSGVNGKRHIAEVNYFGHVRKDIAPLLPQSASLILDVGAGAGTTTAWVRSLYRGSRSIALEGNPAVYDDLQANADIAHIVDLDKDLPDVGSPDLVLCLDVLEHLANPQRLLRHLVHAMLPHGTVIISLPNIAHLSVSLRLLVGRFEYEDAGILDRTHLRFFVRESAIALANEAGLIAHRGIRTGLGGPRTRLLDILTAGVARDQLTKQYILCCRKAALDGAPQGRIEWQIA
jgi:2-polyprenyl-3-methyl-5-hydroxy-6-metoxy-1,4-benzoquinol methylase